MMDSPEPLAPVTKQKRPSSMACDNCRRRKVRCSRERPCERCLDVFLPCSYTSIPRRKGPKGHSAHVLNSLRGSWAEVPPRVPPRVLPQQTPFPTASMTTLHSNDDLGNTVSSSPTPSLAISQSSESSAGKSELSISTSPPSNAERRISSTVLGAHVGLFLQHLYPIMPVIDHKLMADCANPEALHPRRYAYLVALSAATHLQLNLDIGEYESSGNNIISGQDLIQEAVRTVCEYDPLESPHLDTLLTMFFLFCAYGNLNKSDYAWHYLSQAISFLQILKIDREAVYVGLPPAEVEVLRRVYWLIFITERAYALQTGRPVMLRRSIRKPSVLNSEVPALLYGFVSLITLFEQMAPDFYNWNADCIGGAQECSAINSMYQSLSNPAALLEEVSETHQVDIIISQQWLLVSLWKYLVKRYPFQPRDSTNSTNLLPIRIPLMAGKSALACLSSASLPSIDAHGIGMEQKLYDIGESITQLAPHLLSKAPSTPTKTMSATETKDILKSILNVLSRTRGCQSYLFSTLLEKSHDLLQASHLPPPLFTPTEEPGSFHSEGPAPEQDTQLPHQPETTEAAECHTFKLLPKTQPELYLQY
ncbi:hypothetical protein BDW59DRAFT_178946 [Aspergillus cavernicola]|uniref:Zn(2)-C6 fungal-type domain-containing protein n=1 Tax=Aspergillus cavernicola TaxID=176166 RepID=A0ABR4IK69_9EURO